jgi:hypothetical protein
MIMIVAYFICYLGVAQSLRALPQAIAVSPLGFLHWMLFVTFSTMS